MKNIKTARMPFGEKNMTVEKWLSKKCPHLIFSGKADDKILDVSIIAKDDIGREQLINWVKTCKNLNKIRFKDEKRFYKVRIYDERFIIAYRNWKDSYYYVIVDLDKKIRGADNYSSCGGYYDYRDCPEIELREALYRLHMEEPMLLKDCKDLPEDIRQRQIKSINAFGKVPENQQWLDDLGISYRRWATLEIEEIR